MVAGWGDGDGWSSALSQFLGSVLSLVESTVVSAAGAAMSNTATVKATESDDVFDISTSLRVANARLEVEVSIQPAFLKEVEDTMFVSLDCYRSRGVYTLMSSRLVAGPARQYCKLLQHVVSVLKKKRDEAFRQQVLRHVGDHSLSVKSFGQSVTMPKNKRLKAGVLAVPETLEVEVDIFSEEFEGFRLSCLSPRERHNGNTELWVDSKSATWNYISKLVAHTQQQSPNVDTTEPTTSSTTPVDSSGGSVDIANTVVEEDHVEGDGHADMSAVGGGGHVAMSTSSLSTPKR